MIRHLVRLFAISILDVHRVCDRCGSLLDYSGCVRLLFELTGLVGDGMLSFDGIEALSRLQKWHCKRCLGRILGERLSISCDVSTGSGRTSAGISSTRSSSEMRLHLNCACWELGYFVWVNGCPHHPVKNPFTLPIHTSYQTCEPPHGETSEQAGPPVNLDRFLADFPATHAVSGTYVTYPFQWQEIEEISSGDPGSDFAPYGRPTPDFVLEQNRRYMESK